MEGKRHEFACHQFTGNHRPYHSAFVVADHLAMDRSLRGWPKASSALCYTLAISTWMLSVLTAAATAFYQWQLHTTSEEISLLSNGTTQTMNIVYITVIQTPLSRIADALNAPVPVLAWPWCAGLVVMGTRFAGSFFCLERCAYRQISQRYRLAWEQELKRLSAAPGLKM